MLETTVDFVRGEKYCLFFSNEPKNIKVIQEYLKDYSNEVTLMFDKTNQEEGGMEIRCPAKWFKIPKPPRKMSEEQKQKAGERLRKMWAEKEGEV